MADCETRGHRMVDGTCELCGARSSDSLLRERVDRVIDLLTEIRDELREARNRR